MDLIREEAPDFRFVMRGANGREARVNEEILHQSFIVTPDQLIKGWDVHALTELDAAAIAPLIALAPEVIILGCGDTQAFPHPSIMAACLSRGIGLESMVNDAAARTFNVLASEGRNAIAAFILSR